MKAKTSQKLVNWKRRKLRVRYALARAKTARPRLTVFRSSKHIYAQVIDDERGVTLAAASTVEPSFERLEDDSKRTMARRVGALIAERCLAANVTAVVFDRNGYPYNSLRVKNLAEGAREGGLQF
jgi:large subunit ribosomal protein L18